MYMAGPGIDPRPLALESNALQFALRGPAINMVTDKETKKKDDELTNTQQNKSNLTQWQILQTLTRELIDLDLRCLLRYYHPNIKCHCSTSGLILPYL